MRLLLALAEAQSLGFLSY